MFLNVFMCAYVYTLALPNGKIQRQNSVVMSTSYARTVISNDQFPLNKIRAPWRNGQLQVIEVENVKYKPGIYCHTRK